MSTTTATEVAEHTMARHRKPSKMSVAAKSLASWFGRLGKKLQQWEFALLPQSTLFEIEPGTVVINQVEMIHDQFNFKVFRLDLKSKYPAEPMVFQAEEDMVIHLVPSNDTLYLDESTDDLTTMRIGLPHTDDTGEWVVAITGGKYTINIVMFRQNTVSTLRRLYWALTQKTPNSWVRSMDAPEWMPEPAEMMTAEVEEIEGVVDDTESVVVTAPVTTVVDDEVVVVSEDPTVQETADVK